MVKAEPGDKSARTPSLGTLTVAQELHLEGNTVHLGLVMAIKKVQHSIAMG
jgi:hypothetical protein